MVKSMFSGWLVGMALIGSQAAQAESAPPDRITCESIAERWQQCAFPFTGEAVLLRQLSRNACVRNHSWGQDAGGVWVARGCRGEFGVLRPSHTDTQGAMLWRRLRCESRNGTQVDCPVDTRNGVRLLRQLSRPDCTLGRSWGFEPDRIWVSRGCRAEFEVRTSSKPGFWRRLLRDRQNQNHDSGQSLRCESRNGMRAECAVSGVSQVVLVQQLSTAACSEGVSWGWDAGTVWVDAGCRAEFMLW
ncbi:hypothetical protein CO615_02140 [Lysobacteraceae bacterium NML75-0749]|nr:hypothetical protein CO615_02140 [Xanthomonadaceae bacterium NML75-0749]PJK04208.1 hypothetical protein CO609_06555 [Xanthomonadaceae bacterium NML91-0268]